jgi:hypothetical protein
MEKETYQISERAIIFNGRFGCSPMLQFWCWNILVFIEGAVFTLIILKYRVAI